MASDAELAQAPASLLKSLWTTGLWKFFPFLLLYSIGLATLIPIMPTIITNGLASEAAGHPLQCQDYTPDTAPMECHDAHAEAVVLGTWASFVSGAVLSFTCAPIIGSLSDQYGRKPFILLGIGLGFAPMLMTMLNLWGWIPIKWYFLANASNGLCSSLSLMLTAVADLMHQSHRAVSLAFFIGMFNIGIICGPILGAFLDPISAVYVCISLTMTTCIYVIAIVPETSSTVCRRRELRRKLQCNSGVGASAQCGSEPGQCPSKLVTAGAAPKQVAAGEEAGVKVLWQRNAAHADCEAREALLHSHESNYFQEGEDIKIVLQVADDDIGIILQVVNEDPSCKLGPQGGQAEEAAMQLPPRQNIMVTMLAGWNILYCCAWYRKLTMIWVIVSINQTAFQDLLFQYLQLTLGFNTKDQAELLVLLSAASLATKFCLIALMVRKMGEQWTLVFGLSAFALEQVLLGLATTKSLAFGAACVGGLSNVAWPALLALQSSRVGAQQQGAVSGIMQGIGSLASGIGPLGFAYLFSATTSFDSPTFPYCPSLVWFVGASLVVVSILLTCTLHWGDSQEEAKVDGSEADCPAIIQPTTNVSPFIRSIWNLKRWSRLGSFATAPPGHTHGHHQQHPRAHPFVTAPHNLCNGTHNLCNGTTRAHPWTPHSGSPSRPSDQGDVLEPLLPGE